MSNKLLMGSFSTTLLILAVLGLSGCEYFPGQVNISSNTPSVVIQPKTVIPPSSIPPKENKLPTLVPPATTQPQQNNPNAILLPPLNFSIPNQSVYAQIPNWPSNMPVPQNNYNPIVKTVKDKYPPENTWDYIIQTNGVLYYAKNCWKTNTNIITQGCWDWNPFSKEWSWRNGSSVFENSNSNNVSVFPRGTPLEPYWVNTMPSKTVLLRTVSGFQGEKPTEFFINVSKVPLVLNGNFEKTSSITSTFSFSFYKNRGDITGTKQSQTSGDISSLIIDQPGNYYLSIVSTGCFWNIKAGIDP